MSVPAFQMATTSSFGGNHQHFSMQQGGTFRGQRSSAGGAGGHQHRYEQGSQPFAVHHPLQHAQGALLASAHRYPLHTLTLSDLAFAWGDLL